VYREKNTKGEKYKGKRRNEDFFGPGPKPGGLERDRLGRESRCAYLVYPKAHKMCRFGKKGCRKGGGKKGDDAKVSRGELGRRKFPKEISQGGRDNTG